MITSLELENFKGHRTTRINLSQFTVLVGPNASGKTSVLEALHLATQMVFKAPPEVLKGSFFPRFVYHRSGHGPMSIGVGLPGRNGSRPWFSGASVSCEPFGSVTPLHESTAWVWRMSLSRGENPAGFEVDQPWNQTGPLRGYPPAEDHWKKQTSAALFRLDARRVAHTGFSERDEPRVEADGANTAAVLAALKLGDDERFAQVERTLGQLIPHLVKIRVVPTRVAVDALGNALPTPRIEYRLQFDFRAGEQVGAQQVSEGTLVATALLTALYGPARPHVILLDDVEQALHPKAQMELVGILKALLDSDPTLQIVATTHSPFVLDQLEPSQILVCAIDPKTGAARVRSLAEHPEASSGLGAGQIWSLDEEADWIFKVGT